MGWSSESHLQDTRGGRTSRHHESTRHRQRLALPRQATGRRTVECSRRHGPSRMLPMQNGESLVNTYTITHGGLVLEERGTDPGDALERARVLHNLPKLGLTAQRKES